MTELQIWAIVLFGVVLLAAVLLMQPTHRKLDGIQKYRRDRAFGPDADPEANKRPSMHPMQTALAALFGSSMSAGAVSDEGGQSGDDGDHGGSGDGGGADGGAGSGGGE